LKYDTVFEHFLCDNILACSVCLISTLVTATLEVLWWPPQCYSVTFAT